MSDDENDVTIRYERRGDLIRFTCVGATEHEIRQRRRGLDLTQAQLGIALKRPANTIARWERDVLTIEFPGVLRFLLNALKEDCARFGPDRAGFLRHIETFISDT